MFSSFISIWSNWHCQLVVVVSWFFPLQFLIYFCTLLDLCSIINNTFPDKLACWHWKIHSCSVLHLQLQTTIHLENRALTLLEKKASGWGTWQYICLPPIFLCFLLLLISCTCSFSCSKQINPSLPNQKGRVKVTLCVLIQIRWHIICQFPPPLHIW